MAATFSTEPHQNEHQHFNSLARTCADHPSQCFGGRWYSISRLYEFEKEGRLRFRRLGGRTLLEVRTLVELIDSLPQWTPQTERTEAAVAARSARAEQQWRAPTIAEEAPPTLRIRRNEGHGDKS